MNRIMVWILAGLIVLALIYRVANPPEPLAPGPVGKFPNWKSRRAIGEMAAQAVNPSGTAWAGVWNEAPPTGETNSAVWIIDFQNFTAQLSKLPKDFPATSLAWADDKTVRVLTANSLRPKQVDESKVVYINVKTAERTKTTTLDTPVVRVLAWPANGKNMLCELATEGRGMKLAVLNEDGKLVGKEIEPKLAKDTELFADAALANDGKAFVFSVSDGSAKGGRAFYVGDSQSGQCRRAFDLADVPGRIEGIWAASVRGTEESHPVTEPSTTPTAGQTASLPVEVLMVCSHMDEHRQDKFMVLRYSPATGIAPLADGLTGELKTIWSDVPKSMMFITYNGGYDLNVATGKTKRIFDFKNLSEADDYWREEIRNGRLYPVRGRFISVNAVAGTADIREFGKDGSRLRDLLPRY